MKTRIYDWAKGKYSFQIKQITEAFPLNAKAVQHLLSVLIEEGYVKMLNPYSPWMPARYQRTDYKDENPCYYADPGKRVLKHEMRSQLNAAEIDDESYQVMF